MKKIDFDAIKKGSLLDDIQQVTVEFVHNSEKFSIDAHIKPLSYAKTANYFKAMEQGELADVTAEWVADSVCNEKGEKLFSKEEVENQFSHSLTIALLNQILHFNYLPKEVVDDELGKSELL